MQTSPRRARRRRLPSSTRRLTACALLAVLTAGVVALAGGVRMSGPLRPSPVAAATPSPTPIADTPTGCIPIICSPSPTARTPSPTPAKSTPTAPTSSRPPSTSSSSSSSGFTYVAPVFPTLPPDAATSTGPPGTGSPPPPPALQVGAVLLTSAAGTSVKPGTTVVVAATLTARRGTDTYSVPHAKVSFAVTGPSGAGAGIDPPEATSGDTGVAIATVTLGDGPGDRVVTATSGSASAQLTLSVNPAAVTATDTPLPGVTSAPGAVGTVEGGGTTGGRALLVGILIAVGAATLAATLFRVTVLSWWTGRRARRGAAAGDPSAKQPG